MEKEEKVINYLKAAGYSEDRIKKLVLNPDFCNTVYKHIVIYERTIAEISNGAVQKEKNENKRKK